MTQSKKTGVIGFPVDHSISPTIHNHWIRENNVDAANYEKININPKHFEQEVGALIENGMSGLNVTVPLKELAFSFAEELTDVSKQTGAVNTLTFKEGTACGDNTDVIGFQRSLDQETVDQNINNKNCLILGAGGAARAVVCAIHNLGGKVYICNRTLEKAKQIQRFIQTELEVVDQNDLDDVVGEMKFIVNTTSLGLGNTHNKMIDFTKVDQGAFMYDLIYNPKLTSFLSDAQKRNIQYQNGIKMLVEQAAESFNIWHKVLPKNSDLLMNKLEGL